MTTSVAGRRIVITGGTSGIGRAVAAKLVADGADVWVLGSSDDSARMALADLGARGASGCDISDEAAVQRVMAEAVSELGGLDGVFANAGIDGEGKEAVELSAQIFRRVLDVNVIGTFLVAREAARHMTRGSAIVINASVNGLRPELLYTDYNASKAAAISVAKTMALELAPGGIAVTAICPGYFPTRMTEDSLADPQTVEELKKEIPVKRFGELSEVAALVSFLLSPDAGYMTGGVLTIDGGRNV